MLVKDDDYWLPEKESPSSHILKFELSDYRHLPACETFTTLLAEDMGLPVVDMHMIDTRLSGFIYRNHRFLPKLHPAN